MLHRINILIVLALFLAPAELFAAHWQAGVATAKITPAEPMWMSGYASRNKPAEGTLTELWAKALALVDPSGRRAVLVSLDLVGIDRGVSQRVCQRLKKEHDLPREAILLATSHTHTGPVVGDNLRSMYLLDETQQERIRDYTAKLEDTIVAVVGQAIDEVAPARLAWGAGQTDFAVNRRNNSESAVPKLREEGKLRGPVDHDVPVLAVRDEKGKLRAAVFGYACHATVLSFYQWSGDWPGFAQIEIEERHPGAVALFWAGCGADQNPLPRRSVELAEKYGRMTADAVDEVLDGDMQPITGPLAMAYREIELRFAHIPSAEELAKNAQSKNRYEAARAKRLADLLKRDGAIPPTYPYPVQTWRLGKGPLVVALGGEVVVDYALRLKSELGEKTTWVAGYANDVMAYIPSRRVLAEGGYEGGGAMVYYGLPSPWTPDVERLIVEEVKRQADELGAGGG